METYEEEKARKLGHTNLTMECLVRMWNHMAAFAPEKGTPAGANALVSEIFAEPAPVANSPRQGCA